MVTIAYKYSIDDKMDFIFRLSHSYNFSHLEAFRSVLECLDSSLRGYLMGYSGKTSIGRILTDWLRKIPNFD